MKLPSASRFRLELMPLSLTRTTLSHPFVQVAGLIGDEFAEVQRDAFRRGDTGHVFTGPFRLRDQLVDTRFAPPPPCGCHIHAFVGGKRQAQCQD